ncbi:MULTISPECIES: hypothetical protein [unclassified Pseudomonas]|uniref:hypothetical protein n=1 Tax=unclassified Pseudomonas TaxID=196821 RepID=UPI001304E3EF|nr:MULTISPECIES: hypothetical protein [unclassified Pseudomonas]
MSYATASALVELEVNVLATAGFMNSAIVIQADIITGGTEKFEPHRRATGYWDQLHDQ